VTDVLRRRIGNGIFYLSTFLLVIIVALWLRSLIAAAPDAIVWDRGPSWNPDVRRTQLAAQSIRGRLVLGRLIYSAKQIPTWEIGIFGGKTRDGFRYTRSPAGLDWIAPQNWHERLGFKWRRTFAGVWGNQLITAPLDDIHCAAVPYWFLALLTAVPALLKWWAASRVRRKRRLGLCINCGYDLRGSPERCPECGTPNESGAVVS
jgi:hypothetical protein